ncbi:MAG TPA: FlgD immunoglobulin-like domain containing protein [Thermoleophilaceae bacterium]
MGSTLVRVVLGVLVLATVAAFFVTQQLKSEFPLVLRFAAQPSALSPNGDGFKDRTRVGFDLSEPATIRFTIVDQDGNEVRTLVDNRRLAGDTKHRFEWDGRDDDGDIVPDGTYRMRVVRRDEGRVIDSYKTLRVDTIAPQPRLTSVTPSVIAPAEPGQRPRVRISYAGPRNNAPEVRVFRTDGGPPRVVERFRGDANHGATWNGRVRGKPAADGDYAFTVSVRDSAGNLAVAPAAIPTARNTRPHTGVTVRGFALTGPLGSVTAGDAATLTAGPFDRSLRFVLSRLGSPHPLRTGERIGGRFRVHVPEGARTGVYLVRVRAGAHRAVWPLAVAGLPSRRGAERPRPLAILPAITWQGENPVDHDHDGFADTLDRAHAVSLADPFPGGRLPRAFSTQAAPLLDFLERARQPYDLTTDVALARGEGPALGNAPGVAFAGDARWLTPALLRRLRSYVEDGGRAASFGADSLKRSVDLRGDELVDPSRPRRANVFGERTALTRSAGGEGAPMQVFSDELGLFASVDSFFGDFTLFEESLGLPSDTSARESAGRDEQHPALVGYDLGKGLVLRSGTPQWARELRLSRLNVEVPRATERIWALLAGNG